MPLDRLLGPQFWSFLGFNYLYCGYLHGALGFDSQGLVLGVRPIWLPASGGWGFGVFKGGFLLVCQAKRFLSSCCPWSSSVPGLLVPLCSCSLLPLCYELMGSWGFGRV